MLPGLAHFRLAPLANDAMLLPQALQEISDQLHLDNKVVGYLLLGHGPLGCKLNDFETRRRVELTE